MTLVRMKDHFDAPIERIFELATDYAHYPEWNVSYEEIKEVTGPVDKVGTRILAVMKVLGRKMEGWAEIVAIDPPRLLRVSGTTPDGGQLTFTDRFAPAGTGTDYEFEMEYELPAGFLGRIADKLFVERAVERDLRHSRENFKAFVEAKVPLLV